MTIKSLIDQACELAGSTVPQDTMLAWFSDLDGQIAYEFLGVDRVIPYTDADLNAQPLVSEPWGRNIYVPYLEAMIYHTHGETDRYGNAKAMFDASYLDFRKHIRRTLPPRCCWCCGSRPLEINSVRLEDPLNVYQ